MRSPTGQQQSGTPFPAHRTGFTLVEILMVLVVISILAGMVTAAIQNVGQTARIARTKGIISVIDDVLMTKYESYKTRPLPVTTPTFTESGQLSIDVPPREAARVRLNMIRDLMRMELPDRKIDVVDDPAYLTAAAYQVKFIGNRIQRAPAPVKSQVSWYSGGADIPAQLAAYRDRVSGNWSRQYESAECLYLIMATSFTGGLSALEGIPTSNIGDVDGDGMPEILDGWGNPIGFLRWPVGYVSEATSFTAQPDEFDQFRTDWGFLRDDVETPFSLRPLVVSAGEDGEFNIRFGYGNSNDGSDDVRYSRMTWPTSAMPEDDDATNESDMRAGHGSSPSSPYIFVDPYQRQDRTPDQRIGSLTDPSSNARDDNITNFALQASS